jgi:hypothetical protein
MDWQLAFVLDFTCISTSKNNNLRAGYIFNTKVKPLNCGFNKMPLKHICALPNKY